MRLRDIFRHAAALLIVAFRHDITPLLSAPDAAMLLYYYTHACCCRDMIADMLPPIITLPLPPCRHYFIWFFAVAIDG